MTSTSEIEWHEQQEIRNIDSYVDKEFGEGFRKHWDSSAYKGCECNDDFKRSATAFVDDYIEVLNRLKEMVDDLPGGKVSTITVSEEEDEVV